MNLQFRTPRSIERFGYLRNLTETGDELISGGRHEGAHKEVWEGVEEFISVSLCV